MAAAAAVARQQSSWGAPTPIKHRLHWSISWRKTEYAVSYQIFVTTWWSWVCGCLKTFLEQPRRCFNLQSPLYSTYSNAPPRGTWSRLHTFSRLVRGPPNTKRTRAEPKVSRNSTSTYFLSSFSTREKMCTGYQNPSHNHTTDNGKEPVASCGLHLEVHYQLPSPQRQQKIQRYSTYCPRWHHSSVWAIVSQSSHRIEAAVG